MTTSPFTATSKNAKFYHIIIYLLVIIVTFKDTLSGYPFNVNLRIRYVDDLLIILLYALLIFDITKGRIIEKEVKFYLKIFSIFFIFHVLQSITHGSPKYIGLFFFFLRDNYWYFPVFYFSIKYLTEKKIINIIYTFFKIQIFFVLIQIILYYVTQRSLLWEDNINGSLGSHSSHILSYSLILCAPIIISKNKKIMIAFLFFTLILASARSAMLFYSATLILAFTTYGVSLRKFIISLTLTCIIIPSVYIFNEDNFSATLNPFILFSQQNQGLSEGAGASRISFLIYSVNKIKSFENIILGYGTGSYASRTATVLEGDEYKKFIREFPFLNEFISGGSSYNAWIVEQGYIAFVIILISFLYPAILSRNHKLIFSSFLTVLLGTFPQKLMESYSVNLMFWLLFSYFILLEKKSSFEEKLNNK